MTAIRQFYVYALFRPWNGSPCYVGKGKGNRWLHHEKFATNRHLANIIKKAGVELPKVKIREHLTDDEAREIEIALIAAIGRGKNGPLVNLTDGGEGMSGYKHSPETIAKLKVAWQKRPDREKALANLNSTGRRHSADTIAKMTGRKISESARNKMRDAQQKRCSNPEEIQRRRIAKLGTIVSEETRAKIRIAMCGRIVSDKTRSKISAAKKGWKPPPLSAERLAKLTFAGHKHTAEAKEKVAASKRGKPLSPEHRAAVSAAKKGKPGHPHTLESRAKIAAAMIGNHNRRHQLDKSWVD